MIAYWMAYAAVLAALLAGVALAAERLARLCRPPTRGIWTLAEGKPGGCVSMMVAPEGTAIASLDKRQVSGTF